MMMTKSLKIPKQNQKIFWSVTGSGNQTLVKHFIAKSWEYTISLNVCSYMSHMRLASLAKWLSVRLWTKWFWVRIQLESLIPYDIDNLGVFVVKAIPTLSLLKNIKIFACGNNITPPPPSSNGENLIWLDIKTIVVASFFQTSNNRAGKI